MNSVCKLSFPRLLAVLAITLIPFATGATALAQSAPSDPSVDNGTHWYGTYDGVHENISLSSGNLSFCIPLVSVKGPNKHDLTIPLCYNSNFQEASPSGQTLSVKEVVSYFPWVWAPNTPSGHTTPPLGAGWTLTGAPAYYGSNATGGYPVEFMPDGSRFSFVSGVYAQPDGQNANTWLNNTGISQTLIMKDGTKYLVSGEGSSSCPPGGCAEQLFPDGTTINWTNTSATDAVGRTVTESSGSTFTGSNTTSSTAYVQFQYPDPVSTGNTQNVVVQMQTMQFNCMPGQNVGPYGETGSVGLYSMPTAIVLANGLTYTFQYDNCGALRKVTYPTGGYTRYDYSAQQLTYHCQGCNAGPFGYYVNEVSAKHICTVPAMTLGSTTASAFSSSNQCPVAEQTTTYTPTVYGYNQFDGTAGGNQQMVVTDPVGNSVVYQFSQGGLPMPDYTAPSVETSRQYYDASGKLWKTITTQYTSSLTTSTAPGSTFTNTGPGTGDIPPVLPTIQTTTLDNGMTSQIQWSYDVWQADQNDSVLTEERVYDYGQGAPGPLLKRTDYTWLHRINPSTYGWPNANGSGGNHICDKKSSETIYDGSGKMLEQTTYNYDGSGGVVGSLGLLTSKTVWRNTDGASLTTTYVYGQYGNVTKMTDPNGNVTQYSYVDNYADGTNRNSNAFLTKSTDALGHVTQNQYYWGSGLVAATCGENFTGTCEVGLSSEADYASYTYDLMGRKTSTTTGDGGKTTNCYSDLGGTGCSAEGYPLQVTTTETISSGVNKVSTSIAMHPISGSPATTEFVSDPSCASGPVEADTTYDLDGRKSTATNPYCSSSDPTAGTTTYAYDGLSRITRVTHPDGAYATNTYTGRAVLSADEGNGTHRMQRISQTDALGRLIYVCEITAQTQQGSSNNTPSSCLDSYGNQLDVSGSGFLTTYGYDAANSNGPLDSLTHVTQGGVSRSFIYDSLGELRSATNPESGTTIYTYDNDGNLTSKTDAKGIVATYSYDALNRLTSKSYSVDPTTGYATPGAFFQYDQNTSVNGIGRLTTEGTPMTERIFAAYDPVGRVVSDQQCSTLGNCSSNASYTLTYGYDLAGDITSFNNGLTGNSKLSFTGQYNSAGRLSTLSGSTSGGSSGTTNLFTNASYTPVGALTNALIGTGNAPNINFHRDYNNRLLPTDEIDTVATAPGSGSTQISGFDQAVAYSYGSVTFSGAEIYDSNIGAYQTGTFEFFISTGSNPYSGNSYSVNYGQNDTPQTLASNLASQLTCANGGIVRGQAIGATTYFVSCASGVPNQLTYSFTAFLAGGNFEYQGAPPPAFSLSASGSAMTPALPTGPNSVAFSGTEQNNQTGTYTFTVYDDGQNISTIEVTWGPSNTQVTANGNTVATLNGASTASSLASALAAAFPSCSASGTEVTAAATGSNVTLTSCDGHSSYSINAMLAGFSGEGNGTSPAFTAQTGGGSAAPPTALNISAEIYDSGTVTLTVNGNPVATTSYGPGSDASSVVAGLISAGSNNPIVHLAAELPCTSCLQVTAISDGSASDYTFSITSSSSNPSVFTSPSFLPYPNPVTMTGGGGSAPLYNWSISSYAPNGDVLAMSDSVMGTWSYAYDDFNRLTSGSATAGADNGLTLGWTYDRYGNRWAQNATGSGNVSAVQPQLTFYGTNGVNSNRVDGWSYDADGNLLNDGRNSYAYDAEGRIIAINGQSTYVYDAEGRRVAKYSGSTITAHYLLGLGGEQVTELNSSGGWVHSNVFTSGGRMLATFTPSGSAPNTYHFHLTDWLGTNRMQTSATGGQEEVCYSYPFGDGLNCTGTDATEHHFTGKERDTESGLDYFFARYYSSILGRFMTPDWAAKPTAVPYATFGDPQTLNLYAYVSNNPNKGIDLDGHVDPCKDVHVTAVAIEQPTFQRNATINVAGGPSITVTGEMGKITFQITKGIQPVANVGVREQITGTKTVNGQTTAVNPALGATRSGSTPADMGKFPDYSGGDTRGQTTQAQADALQKSSEGETFTKVISQTLTLSMPDGTTCYATDTRTMTNVTADGSASSVYSLTVTDPVVSSTPPAAPTAPAPSVSAPTPTN